MEDTAQNPNTQFQYPDFSGTPTPTSTSQNQGATDDQKLADLRKSLNDLIATDKKSTESPSVPEVTTNLSPEIPVNSYTIEPTPIPALAKDLTTTPVGTSTIPTAEEKIAPPVSENLSVLEPTVPDITPQISPVVPAPPPLNMGGLESIMPTLKKPKAMNRDPKSNNLAAPLLQKTDVKNSLIPEDATGDVIESNVDLSIDRLLGEAVSKNASDLHLAVGYPPIMRLDGELVDISEKVLTSEEVENLIFSVLSDEKKELLEVNREIDFAYTYEGAASARFRVNAYYSMKNLSAAFRLIPARIRTIEELLLPQIYHQFAKLKQGLILVTGPTGHGKSTTLAAILEDINRTRFCHLVTIEDPIEYVFEGKKALIDQREMNDDTHSWSIALRSALRQDPDVILVGEMRDYETIAAAITLAETGHLVFATLHTNSAAQTVDRIIDVFPENQQQQVRAQIANTLEAVVAQRLIPLDQGGRRAVSEIMLNNAAISNLIREGKAFQIDNVIRTSSDVGMTYLEKSLVALVREGVISVQKAQEYAVHPEEVLRLLKS